MSRKLNWFKFEATKETLLLFGFVLAAWTANFIADIFLGTYLFYLFYHGLFALICCIALPVYSMVVRRGISCTSIGLRSDNINKSILIGLVIEAASIAGRLYTTSIIDVGVRQLIYIIVAMVFSTLFEEVFFRGILLSRLEKQYGVVIAVILSSLFFALYHSAQSFIGFDIQELVKLFLVGLFFGISYKITNSIVTSYIVNLPHAILTFIESPKYVEYSYNMNFLSTIVTGLATIAGLLIINKIVKTKHRHGEDK